MIRHGGGVLACCAVVVAVAGCTGTPKNVASVDAGAAYAAVVRWQLGSTPGSSTTTAGKPIIYITPSGGRQITAVEQAAVIAAVKDEAVVRFADLRDEALDVGVDGRPVRDGGVLLLVGSVTESPPPVDVDVEVYRTETDDRSFSVRVDRVATGFGVTASTVTGSG